MPSRSHESTADQNPPTAAGPDPSQRPPAPAFEPGAAARRMRTLVAAFFMLDGFLFANWVVRVPQIKAHVGASPGALGLALLGVSGGAVVTMTVTGRFCTRFGSRPVAVATSALLALSVILPPLTTSVGALGAVLLILGAGYGGLNVAINSAAVDVVEEVRKPIMPMFHAAYSGGGLIGAVAGGVIAVYLSPAWHLTLVGVAGLALTAVLGTMMLRCPPLAAEQVSRRGTARRAQKDLALGAEGECVAVSESAPSRPRAPRRVHILVIVFGTIVLCSSYGEGAMADWAALHLRTDLHTGVGLAAAGYASFSIAMVAGRLSGSWLLARLGRTTVLVLGGWLAAGGMVLAALAPVLPLVLVGFVLVGLGLSNQFPAVIGRAGTLNGPAGVAVASTLGYSGMLAGPPVIGFLADLAGLPIALLSIAALAAAAAVIAVFAARAEASMLPGETDGGPEPDPGSDADCAAVADPTADPIAAADPAAGSADRSETSGSLNQG